VGAPLHFEPQEGKDGCVACARCHGKQLSRTLISGVNNTSITLGISITRLEMMMPVFQHGLYTKKRMIRKIRHLYFYSKYLESGADSLSDMFDWCINVSFYGLLPTP